MGNLKNAAIAILVPLPTILFYVSYLHHHTICTWCTDHPLVVANLLFFLNVDLLFWVIGLLQSIHWLIDLYWTVVPVMLVHYHASHPLATSDHTRSKAVILLTWVWSVRLTHSYFRREGWEWGAREDWRFEDMRRRFGKHWWWLSFFAVYVSQQVHSLVFNFYMYGIILVFVPMQFFLNLTVFLLGICHPMYVVHTSQKEWNVWDVIATITCLTGVLIAYFADTQLYKYMAKNKMLKELGAPTVVILDSGLWHYSRHPNYFGEQLWWWGLAIFAWNVENCWVFVGPFVNTLCLMYVMVLVEKRMLKQENRAEAYREYQKATFACIPWFKYAVLQDKCKSK